MNQQQNRPRICVVGSAMIDLVAYAPRLPRLGETLVGTGFKQGFGGKGSNQAVMAARLGAAVTMVVKLGRDDFGRATVENYRQQNIDTRYVYFDEQQPSGVAPIWVDSQGNNSIIIVPGANSTLSAADVDAAASEIAEASVVICQCEVADEANIQAFRIARSAGVRTVLNPAPARQLPAELLALTDLLVPNETETELLTGMPVTTSEEALAAARELRKMGVGQVIVTLGERGALVLDDDQAVEVPAPQVNAVDSTGAGDAFIGSLAYYLALGRSLHDAVAAANVVAALSVTQPGTQTSFPTPEQVDAFTASQSAS